MKSLDSSYLCNKNTFLSDVDSCFTSNIDIFNGISFEVKSIFNKDIKNKTEIC